MSTKHNSEVWVLCGWTQPRRRVAAPVVFPAASRASVISRTSSPMCDISAMPPALSVMGPNASMARVVERVPSTPSAAMLMP